MNLTSPTSVRELLESHDLRLSRRMGQHFLADSNVLRQIADAAELSSHRGALEIGPGIGTLTQELSHRCAMVTAIEYDRRLMPVLEQSVIPLGNVRVLHGDAVRLLKSTPISHLFAPRTESDGDSWIGAAAPPADLLTDRFACVSNIPYNITSPLVIGLLQRKQWFTELVLMMQEEVAQRIVARPGSPSFGALSVFVQYHAHVEKLASVPASCFFPPPRVDSAVVRLTPVAEGTVAVSDPERLLQVSRALFGQRRKTALNALANLPDHPARFELLAALESAGIDPGVRGETLELTELARLADRLPAARGREPDELTLD